jgi:predicted amidohydrolase
MGTLCAVHGAQMVLVPSASPARGFEAEKPGNLLRYERMLRALCEEHAVYSVNAMLCGFEGGKGFVGGSMIFDPLGQKLVQAPVNEEELIIARVDYDLITIARAKKPLLGDLKSSWSDIRRIVDGG